MGCIGVCRGMGFIGFMGFTGFLWWVRENGFIVRSAYRA